MKKTSLILLMFILVLAAVSVCSAQSEGDKSLYDKAYALYQNGKYYNAHELFVQSQYGDWERMAKKCIRRWPKNGEIWRDSSQWLQDTYVTCKVEQPDDTAVFVQIFKDDQILSKVFIGGNSEVTVGIPGNGTYKIKDGVGSDWYGPDDIFGEDGAYETMIFDGDSETIYLSARYEYTITLNVEGVNGEDIGSKAETWDSFK